MSFFKNSLFINSLHTDLHRLIMLYNTNKTGQRTCHSPCIAYKSKTSIFMWGKNKMYNNKNDNDNDDNNRWIKTKNKTYINTK